MAVAVVQRVTRTSNGVLTFASPPTPGNVVFLLVSGNDNPGLPTPGLGAMPTYLGFTALGTAVRAHSSFGGHGHLYYRIIQSGDPSSANVTVSPGYIAIQMVEVSGLNSGGPYGSASSTSDHNTTTIAMSVAGAASRFVIAGFVTRLKSGTGAIAANGATTILGGLVYPNNVSNGASFLAIAAADASVGATQSGTTQDGYWFGGVAVEWGGSEFAAAFSGTPLTGNKALAVQFTDLSTGGGSAASVWEWDFGDGSTSTEQNPYHVYADAGTYTVTLIAHNDDSSDSETKVAYITVTTPTASDDVTSPTSGWWVDWGDDGFSAALGGGTGEYELARSMPEAGSLAATGGDEITPWVKKVTWQRGGQGDLLGGQMPGSCVITVNNTDGRFNPDNASGPYYGLLKPGRKVWGGAERTSGTTKGLFGGYLKDIVPIPGPKKEAQLICHDVFGVWKDSRLKVTFSPYRTAKSYRGAILNALGVTATQRSLADEPNQLRVSGANEKNALQVLEQLNAATATRHYCLPADDANDLFLYRTVGRNQNLGNATPALALDENDITAMSGLRLSIDTVVNYQQVSMHPYAFLVFTRVWESGDVPFTMDVSTSKSLDVVFANWVRNAEVKVAYTGAAVTAAITHYGKSATVTLTAAGPTTVTSLYVRGQLASEPSQTVQVAQDLSSQGVYNIVREGNPIDLDLLAIAGDAFAVAEAVVVRSAHPRYRPQVAMRNRFDKYFQADLGDVIEQSVSELSMTRRFEIVGASGAISDGGKVWDFGWTYLETPIQTTLDLFHLNDSLLDGADVLGF